MVRPAILFVAFVVSSAALAQPTAPATPLPVGVASDDLAFAVDTNPSLLPYVPRYSLVASHLRAGDSDADVVSTNVAGAFSFAGLGVGLGFDRLDSASASRGRFSFALAYALSRQFSAGFAVRVVGPNGTQSGTSGLDLSFTARPSRFFSFAVVANDVLGPVGFDANRDVDIPANFGGYVGLRPLGSDAFTTEIGLSANTDAMLVARLYASLSFSHVGRAFLVARLDDLARDAEGSLLAGVELRLDGVGVGSAVLAERNGATGFFAYAAIDGRAPSGLVERDRLVDVVLDGAVSPRELVRHLLTLDHARVDPRIVGAVVRLRGSGIGLAAAQELRYAITRLTESDQLVTCVLESPTGAELYACGAATEIFVEESGTVRILGPSVDLVTFGGLLETLGVHADFVRIGAYKSAPERFTHREPSAESIAQTTEFLDGVYDRMVFDLATDLSVDRGVIREAIDRGPLTPTDAETVGLVDGSLDVTDLDDELERLHGRAIPLERDERAPDRRWGSSPRVAVVMIEGPIVDRDNVSIPLLGTRATGADTIVETLDALRHDSDVRSVVLRIDSPGGSSTASDRIWRAVRRLARVKPVVASMGSIAASGGYYVATAAPTIYADPSTLTGSIGIYYGKVDIASLAARLGIGVVSVGRGEHAGALSMFRPFDDDERARLEHIVHEGYDLFLSRVADGRNRSVESLDGLCEGRIWSGDSARALGLVDRLGGLVAAVAHARSLAELDDDSDVVILPAQRAGIIERVIGSVISAPSIPLARLSGVAWLAHANTEGSLALAPFDDGVH